MSTESTPFIRIYMLVRTVSTSQTKPDIKTAYKIVTDTSPDPPPTYKWCDGFTYSGTGMIAGRSGNIWIGIPNDSAANCTILNAGNIASNKLIIRMKEDVNAKMTEKLLNRYCRAEIRWSGGVDLARDDACAALILEDDQEIDGARRYAWWEILHVDVEYGAKDI